MRLLESTETGQFRSKLEFYWSQWFTDHLIEWIYEPFELIQPTGWLPDFALRYDRSSIFLVEIKPTEEVYLEEGGALKYQSDYYPVLVLIGSPPWPWGWGDRYRSRDPLHFHLSLQNRGAAQEEFSVDLSSRLGMSIRWHVPEDPPPPPPLPPPPPPSDWLAEQIRLNKEKYGDDYYERFRLD